VKVNSNYTLITAACNEEKFIEQTIKSVIAQTRLPLKWIIVSNGSTDRTEDIVEKYSDKYHWIELVKKPGDVERNFSAKVFALTQAYERLKHLEFSFNCKSAA